ncbi:hypothetical protein LTR84_009873 [Exophiala bonariae]|uniref:MMS19 nucleotide excision repair protein n=1 Tax=Exophiala bonariae TaxID=1690606 RepID=A0AAV9NKN1_9EURO|nr:hypothetical protein LTR84_009873 [Exophiala bonariae]
MATVQNFGDFLTGIQNSAVAGNDKTGQVQILKNYCDEQSSASHEEIDFPDILGTWAHASETNDEAVLATAPSVLVQFFQIISDRLDFRDFGLSLCHSLLKRDQVRLFDKALSAPRSKDALIAVSLQLLTEIISFDEGALSNNVFGRRDTLYRRLDGILGSALSAQGKLLAAHQSALRFLSANFKYLDTTAKTEIINHGKTLYSAIRSLPSEAPHTVLETLDALERWVLDDKALPKQLKGRCFNSGVLTALSKLYEYDQDLQNVHESEQAQVTVRDSLHRLLLRLCTSTEAILLPQAGWYPSGTNPDIIEQDENTIDLGLDSPYYFDDYTENVPVKNGGLSTFIHGLKPGEDLLHAKLVNAIFAAAPELVAEYISKKQKFLAPSGDDPLWRGQFAFLFSVVQLDVPKNFGWPEHLPQTPPPLSIAIENILPRSFERATSSKCLHSEDDIVVFSTLRFLSIALDKLDSVLRIIDQATTKSHLWSQAWLKLVNSFVERAPPAQEVVTTLQKLGPDKEQLRTSVLECLAKYYKVLPSAVAGLKFDITPLLSKALISLESKDSADSLRETFQQLSHELEIATGSSTTKWWHKATSESLSTASLLLKFCVNCTEPIITKQARHVLGGLLSGKGVLAATKQSLDALLTSLTSTKKWQAETTTYQFLDNCMIRTIQRPVKYLDPIENLQIQESDKKELSLVACCVAEQWSFVLKNEDNKTAVKNIAGWIARFYTALDSAGENYRVLMSFQNDMLIAAKGNEVAQKALIKAFEQQRKKPAILTESLSSDDIGDVSGIDVAMDSTDHVLSPHQSIDLTTVFAPFPVIPKSMNGLTRWENPDFESDVQSGRLGNLIRCLISPDHEIRLQAFHTLQTVMHAVEQSTYTEKTQLYLLLGEVSETIRNHHSNHTTQQQSDGSSETQPPPSVISALANSILNVISDPSSPFYQKTNAFLLRSPSWNLNHVIQRWANSVFHTEPESDDTFALPGGAPSNPVLLTSNTASESKNAQTQEISHFIHTILIPSIRTPADVDLLRRAQIYTRLFTYYAAPICPSSLRKLILQVVHQTCLVAGGSEMLITRTGVREWLRVVREVRGHSGSGAGRAGKVDIEMRELVNAVLLEIGETCDKAVVERWEAMRPLFKIAGTED